MLFKNVHNVPGIPRNLFCSPCTYAGYTIHFTNCFGIKVLQGTSGMPGTQFISQTLFWKSNYCLFKCRVHNSFQKLFWTSKYSRVHPACQVHNSFHKLFLEKKTIAFLILHDVRGMPGVPGIFISQTVLDIKVLQGTSGMPGTRFISQTLFWKSNYCLFNCSRCTWHARCTRHAPGMPGTHFISQTVLDIKVFQGTSGMAGMQFISQTLFWKSNYCLFNSSRCTWHARCTWGVPGMGVPGYTIHFTNCFGHQSTAALPRPGMPWHAKCTQHAGYTIHFTNCFGHQSTPGYIRNARYTIHFTNCFGHQSTAVITVPGMPDVPGMQGTSGMPGRQFISQTILESKILLLTLYPACQVHNSFHKLF